MNHFLILFFGLCTLAESKSKIYDCFLFFNELELLTIRLEEMYECVDNFVLVEAKETFRGNSKPLYYEENKVLYEKFADKIIHVVIDTPFFSSSTWAREEFHRNQIMRGLTNCQPDDIILISDVDEIVRASKIDDVVKTLGHLELEFKMVLCNQTMYRYFFNRFEAEWPGTIALFYKDLQNHAPDWCRLKRVENPVRVKNAGWHFTSMGGHQKVVAKLGAFSHVECDTEENRDPQKFINQINALRYVDIDETYPSYVQNHIRELMAKGFIEVAETKNVILNHTHYLP